MTDYIKTRIKGNFLLELAGILLMGIGVCICIVSAQSGIDGGKESAGLLFSILCFLIGFLLFFMIRFQYLFANTKSGQMIIRRFLRKDFEFQVTKITSFQRKEQKIKIYCKNCYITLVNDKNNDAWQNFLKNYSKAEMK